MKTPWYPGPQKLVLDRDVTPIPQQKQDFPAAKLKGTWISDTQEIDDWRRGIIRNRNKKGDSDGAEKGNGKNPARKAQPRKG